MKIIISPTKKMKTEEYISPLSRPLFLEKTKEILSFLVSLTDEEKAVADAYLSWYNNHVSKEEDTKEDENNADNNNEGSAE